ncbi:MAG: hypothetical protein ACI4UL_04675, partial [Muribaculaceae bacterium]
MRLAARQVTCPCTITESPGKHDVCCGLNATCSDRKSCGNCAIVSPFEIMVIKATINNNFNKLVFIMYY